MDKLKHLLFQFITLLWNIFPAKKWLSKIIHGFPKLKAKLYQDLRYKGIMVIELSENSFKIYNPGFTTIENELFWYGLNKWERLPLKVWTQLTKNSQTILDIGANTGVYSLISAAENKNAKILAFEPVKRTISLLKQNKELNNFDNIEIIEKAVSNIKGNFPFYDENSIWQYSASLNENMLADQNDKLTYTIQTITLDQYLQDSTDKIDLIKLDVEMHEPEVIQGMLGLLSKYKPTILIEVLTEQIASQIEDLIKPLNYTFYALDNVESPQKVNNLFQANCHNYLMISTEKHNITNLK